MTYVIEARVNTTTKHKAYVYEAGRREIEVSKYGRVKLYRSRK